MPPVRCSVWFGGHPPSPRLVLHVLHPNSSGSYRVGLSAVSFRLKNPNVWSYKFCRPRS